MNNQKSILNVASDEATLVINNDFERCISAFLDMLETKNNYYSQPQGSLNDTSSNEVVSVVKDEGASVMMKMLENKNSQCDQRQDKGISCYEMTLFKTIKKALQLQ